MCLGPGTLSAIARIAEAAYPYEGCGLLLDSGEVRAVRNLLHGTDAGRVRFAMDPSALLGAQREGTLLAIFHSHCDAPAELSPEDVQALSPGGGVLYPQVQQIVIAVERGRATACTAYRWDGRAWMTEFSVFGELIVTPR